MLDSGWAVIVEHHVLCEFRVHADALAWGEKHHRGRYKLEFFRRDAGGQVVGVHYNRGNDDDPPGHQTCPHL